MSVSGWLGRLGFCSQRMVCYFIRVCCQPASCLSGIVRYCHDTYDGRGLPLGLAFGGEPVPGADFDGGQRVRHSPFFERLMWIRIGCFFL